MKIRLISTQVYVFMMRGCNYDFSKLMKIGVNLGVPNTREIRYTFWLVFRTGSPSGHASNTCCNLYFFLTYEATLLLLTGQKGLLTVMIQSQQLYS